MIVVNCSKHEKMVELAKKREMIVNKEVKNGSYAYWNNPDYQKVQSELETIIQEIDQDESGKVH